MTQLVKDVMTPDPICLNNDTSIEEAARIMRDKDIGDVLVVDNERVAGIVTDRDIVTRTVAEGLAPATTRLGSLASASPVIIGPEARAEEAVNQMRDNRIRRLPVCAPDGKPLGILSLGDLAEHRDRSSALGGISADRPN